HRKREILALVLLALGALTFLSLFGFAGSLSALWATLLTRFAGWGAYVLAGIELLRRQENVFGEFEIPWQRIVALEVMFGAGCGLLSLALAADDRQAVQLADSGQAGGYLGLAIASLLTRAFGSVLDANIAVILASLLLIVLMIAMLRFAFDLTRLGNFLTRTLENLRPTPAAATAPGSSARFAPTNAPPLPSSRPLVQLPLPRQ